MAAKYFVSDFHFGINKKIDSAAFSNFENFCEKKLSNGDELYILGDFFEFWIEYKNFVQAEYAEIYAVLLNAKKRGVRIFLVRGNHDFIRGSFFENLGFSVFDKEIRFEWCGKKVLCIHGDGITNDFLYSLMKFVLRNAFFQFLYKLLPPDFSLWLAKKLSGLSRKKNRTTVKNDSRKSKYRKFAFDFAAKKNCDILIMGHSHIPDLTHCGGKTYANSGVWFENPTYITLEEDKISLKKFSGTNDEDIVLETNSII